MDEECEAQRDKAHLSNETELLTGDRGKKEPRSLGILHGSVKMLEQSTSSLHMDTVSTSVEN